MAQLYKKTGTCSRPSGAQTDYPMYLVVGESAGSYLPTNLSPQNMTANNSPSPYVVSSSGDFSAAWPPYKAFDQYHNNYWISNSGSFTSGVGSAWIKLDRGATPELGLARYSIEAPYQSGEVGTAPKAWTLHGSNNDSDWTLLDTVTGQTSWTANEIRAFDCDDGRSTPYRYLRWTFTEIDSTGSYVRITNICFYTTADVHCSGHCQDDFGDIRFHSAADAELKYMIDWGSLQGTTPNQSVGVWVAASPGMSDTDVVLKYGDAALTDASDPSIFDLHEDAEWGDDDDPVTDSGGSVTWIDRTYNGVISTDTAYAGTRSIALNYDATNPISAQPTITVDEGKAIRFWLKRYTNQSYIEFFSGAGDASYGLMLIFDDNDLSVKYKTSVAPTDTGLYIVSGAWNFFEIRDINYTAHTATLQVNDATVTVSMRSGLNTGGGFWFYGGKTGGSAGYFTYIDDLIVRKYANPEPTWGTWGAEVEISAGSDCIVEAVTATLSPSASASPGISATSTTGTLGPSALAGVAISVAAASAILGPVADANLGISIAAASAILGPSASADFDINSEASVLIICQSATLNPSASAGVQISVASQTATLGPSVGTPSIYLILSAESAVLDPSASAAPAIGITATPAILDPSAGIPGLTLLLSAASAVLDPSASAGALTVFQYENPVILYYFTLTGADDGETDATIPISSFQARYRDGESTYLSVVIPDYDTYEDIVDARSSGDMVLTMAYSHAGTVYHQEEIMRVDLDTNGIRKDQGGRSQSITLVGHRTMSFSAQTLTLKNVTYRRTGNAGEISYRCANPDIFLRPGDTAVYGSDSFTVGLITYSVSSGYTAMDVTEAKS